ncbi:MAG: hypothetical protein AB1Z23_01820 [Eubacteriales bacterium]
MKKAFERTIAIILFILTYAFMAVIRLERNIYYDIMYSSPYWFYIIFNILFFTMSVGFLVIAFVYSKRWIKKLINKQIAKDAKFIKTLNDGLANETVANSEDIISIYEGINKAQEDIKLRNRNIILLLRQFKIDYIHPVEKTTSASGHSEHKGKFDINEAKKIIDECIKDFESYGIEYSGFTPTERSLLIDIANFNADGKTDDVKRKIDEIALVLEAKNNELQSLRNTKRVSVPIAIFSSLLAIAGIVVTIITSM